MIQLGLHGVSNLAAPEEIGRLRREFGEQRCLRLPGLLNPELLDRALALVARADFDPRLMPDIGTRSVAASPALRGLLLLVVQRPAFCRFLEELTDRAPLLGFDGNVNRLLPGSGQRLDWHRDSGDPARLLGMSLHLGPHAFEGGRFQLRESRSGRVLYDEANTGAGDAVVFDLAPELERRVTPVTGEVPRTAFVGWFLNEPYRGLGPAS